MAPFLGGNQVFKKQGRDPSVTKELPLVLGLRSQRSRNPLERRDKSLSFVKHGHCHQGSGKGGERGLEGRETDTQ